MRIIYTACLSTLLFFTTNAQSPQVGPYIAWEAVLGGNDADELNDIIPTADGGFLLAGQLAKNSCITAVDEDKILIERGRQKKEQSH